VTNTPELVLASASPARLKTLRAAGLDATVIVSGVDESAVTEDDPARLSLILARHKARAVAERLNGAGRRIVIGCDSVLGFDGRPLGKPRDAADAVQRWRAMRGRQGVLYTGHCLVDTDGWRSAERTAATTVHFADVTDTEIDAYVASGEPLHVAGAFTIDGLGGAFVERIEGDAGTVIGLSLPLLRRLLADLGVRITDLWREDGIHEPAR
jgi:septum formation protein